MFYRGPKKCSKNKSKNSNFEKNYGHYFPKKVWQKLTYKVIFKDINDKKTVLDNQQVLCMNFPARGKGDKPYEQGRDDPTLKEYNVIGR